MTRPSSSDRQVLAQVPAARRRAKRARLSTPHADRVRYDRSSRQLHIRLTNGAALTIPIALVPSLRAADDRDLREVTVGPAGVGLRWERLDADLTVASLVRLVLGTQALLRVAGSVGGAMRTTAKSRAARLNGLKGGRPRNTAAKAMGLKP
jgi:hypothetical protein